MVIDRALIRKELADKHNIIIADNDPIMSLLIFNDIILGAYIDEVTKKVKNIEGVMEEIADKYNDESINLAEKIITQALEASRASIKSETESVIKTISALKSNSSNTTNSTDIEKENNSSLVTTLLIINALITISIFILILIKVI